MQEKLPLAARIGRENIEAVVHAHYRRLLTDETLRGYFTPIGRLQEHEARVAAFWWSALGGRSDGAARPGAMDEAHRPLALPEAHLWRWLELLGESLVENVEADEAAEWLALAETIGQHMLRRGLVESEQG